MTCRDVTDFLAAYLAHDLAPDVEQTFSRHLGACEDCRVYLHQYEQTIIAGRSACSDDKAQVPEDLVRAILTSLKSA
jgi:predicted anti-sigma-YlaC factor YlaD